MKQLLRIVLFFVLTLSGISAIQAQQCNVIYVTPAGSGSNAGTRANPTTLPLAIGTATAAGGGRIWLAAGTYTISNTLQLSSNTIIDGGFDPVTWVKSNGTPTILHRDALNPLPAPANALGLFGALNATGIRLQDLTIIVDDAPGPGISLYGIYLNGCSNYNIVRCSVTTGAGAPGIAGVPGAAGAAGSAGSAGMAGAPEGSTITGGAGGAGGNTGGQGATVTSYKNVNGGATGGGACGGPGGPGGSGPDCSAGCFFGPPSCGSVTAGQAGTAGGNGSVGSAGAAGPAGTVQFPGYFVPGGAGTAGTAGTPGCGGGGGGGGGGRQENGTDDWGGSGGGGGGGGYGGQGGQGGTGGSGSFAVFLVNNGAGGNIVDCSLTAGPGGPGGVGGAGGTGGGGGAGGAGGAAGVCGNGTGGVGGAGGAGGAGGVGGNGANGPSQNLSENGGTPVTQSNITTVPGNPPVITADYHGCTNAEVIYTSSTSGSWNFGAGANPATATGTGPFSVIYTTLGRKTVSVGGTAFTDFVDIFYQQNTDSLDNAKHPPIVGCPDTVFTTMAGTYFDWDFGAGAIPTTLSGAGYQNAPVVFGLPGTYTVKVWVTTACCGRVKDSMTLNVGPNTLGISMAASNDSVCAGGSLTYTAIPDANHPNGYNTYTFLVNNNPVQSSAVDTFVASNLQAGDSITVLGFDGVCYSNPSVTQHPIVLPIPTVTVSSSDLDDTICAGDPITFTATPAGYDNYNFYNGGSLISFGPQNSWSTTNLGQSNNVYVVVTENGCTSTASNSISTYIKLTPLMTIAANDSSICQGDNVTVIATSIPSTIDYYDFSLNGSSIQNSASNTYSSAAINNGDVITVTGGLLGCTSAPSSIITFTVTPIPTVTLSSSDADNSICQGDAVTFTATPAGYTAYTFADNGNTVQNTSSNTYTTNLLTNGNSITVIAVNNGCSSPASSPIVTAVQPAPVVDAGTNASKCVDAGLQTLTGFTPAGGAWTGTGITNATGDFDPSVAGPGNFSLVYSYTDAVTGCAGRDSIIYTVFALPTVSLPATYDLCIGQSVTLNASGGASYVWSPGTDLSSTTVANPVANPTTTTIYTVTVTDNNNCSGTASTTVNANPNPVADFSVQDVCQGLPSNFINNSTPATGVTYQWNFGDGITSSLTTPNHTYGAQGTYTVTLVATLGNCTATYTDSTTIQPGVTANFTANPTVGYNDDSSPIQFSDHSVNADTWNWTLGDGTTSTIQNPSHVYASAGRYTISLLASNQYGCSDSLTREEYITIYELPIIFVPNAFTPDGNGQNDVLYAICNNGTQVFDWKIFNRWGELVFESNSEAMGWDGRYKGKDATPGVYTYVLNVVFSDLSNRKLKGTVTLLR